MPAAQHLLLTDSGLGGLNVCAGIERLWREAGRGGRLTFFSAAGGPGRGYNDLPDMAARAALLDRTLEAMEGHSPDRIVLACNTLSVLYGQTRHARRCPGRVVGIVEAGVRLFARALAEDPEGGLLLLGTRTTVESGVHSEALLRQGLAAERVAGLPCHGLATAIEEDPDGPAMQRLLEQCLTAVPGLALRGRRLYAGLACTHFAFAGERIREALERATGLPVILLDPNEALAREVAGAAAAPTGVAPEASASASAGTPITVRVLSKVPLPERSRRLIADKLTAVSEPTARALLAYTHDPALF